jgi:hypothetical protein
VRPTASYTTSGNAVRRSLCEQVGGDLRRWVFFAVAGWGDQCVGNPVALVREAKHRRQIDGAPTFLGRQQPGPLTDSFENNTTLCIARALPRKGC